MPVGTCMFSAAPSSIVLTKDAGSRVTAEGKIAQRAVIIGSAGTSGSDAGLAWMVDTVREIAREQGLHFKLATIH